MTVYGYARVSSEGQNLEAQREELFKAGAARVFEEKISGAISKRPQLEHVLDVLRFGDCLLVTRLDRLARSTRDLLNILAAVGEKEATFRSISDAWADTTTAHGRLILTVLGGLAEFERELIKSRCGAGITRARDRGVKFGRPLKLTPHQRQEALTRRDAGESLSDIGRSFNVAHSTVSRLVRDRCGRGAV